MTPSQIEGEILINPTAAKSHWTPEPWQIIQWPNPNYLNSLWLGTVAQVVMLPGRLWNEVVLMATLHGSPLKALAYLLWFLPVTSLLWLVWGLRGQAFALAAPLELITRARIVTVEESIALLASGNEEPLIFKSKGP